MPKTVIEKSPSPSPDVTVFSVSGTLGFHEKDTLEKLFDECRKRSISRVVLEVSKLTSLGGGCAKIIEAVTSSGEIALGITGAKATVLKFLKDADRLHVAESVEAAVAHLSGAPVAPPTNAQPPPGARETAKEPESSQSPAAAASEVDARNAQDGVVVLGLDVDDGDGKPDETLEQGETADSPEPRAPVPAQADQDPGAVNPNELRKRIVQYNTLFSLNSDFYRIQDRKNLLEMFLLTTIAQVGVESAVFLEHREGYFTPASAKGVEADELRGFALSAEQLDLSTWVESLAIHTVESAPFSDEVKAPLLSLGCSYVAPFVAHGEFRGILMLGKPLKADLDETTISFLKILINQAALAYESTQRFEEEKQRTLGLVQ
ncbi:MAG: hypothetical protein PVF33_11605, partial [Candidatus Latescibacterota bacterium]